MKVLSLFFIVCLLSEANLMGMEKVRGMEKRIMSEKPVPENEIAIRLKKSNCDVTLEKWKVNLSDVILEKSLWHTKLALDAQRPIVVDQVSKEDFDDFSTALTKKPGTEFNAHYAALNAARQRALITTAGILRAVSLTKVLLTSLVPHEVITHYFKPHFSDYCVNYLMYKTIVSCDAGSFFSFKPEKIENGNIDIVYQDDGKPVYIPSLVQRREDYSTDFVVNPTVVLDNVSWHNLAMYINDDKNIVYIITPAKPSLFAADTINTPGLLWMENGHTGMQLLHHKTDITHFVFSPNGCYLAAGSGDVEKNLSLLLLGKKTDFSDFYTLPLIAHKDSIAALCFNKQSTLLASGSNGIHNNIALWNMRGELITLLDDHQDDRFNDQERKVSTILFNYDGTRLATASHTADYRWIAMTLWDVSDPGCIVSLRNIIVLSVGMPDMIVKIMFTPSDSKCIVLCASRKLFVLNAVAGICLVEHTWGLHHFKLNLCVSLLISSDERFFVTVAVDALDGNRRSISMRSLHNGSLIAVLRLLEGAAAVDGIGFTPFMQSVVACTSDYALLRWNLYNRNHDQQFAWLEKNMNLVQASSLYRLVKAAENGEELCLNENEFAFHALEELSQSPAADVINKYLPHYCSRLVALEVLAHAAGKSMQEAADAVADFFTGMFVGFKK